MNKKKQAGMNSLLLLFVLAMVGFLLTCFFKLGPAYLDNHYIVEALRSLAQEHPDDLQELTKTSIRQELSRFYTINNVRGEAAQALEIERRQDRIIITVAYETRVPLIANIDVVIRFNNVLDSSRPEECCSVSEEDSAKK